MVKINKRKLLAVAVFSITSVLALSTISYGNIHYDISAELLADQKMIVGKETIQFKNPFGKPVDQVVIILEPNLLRKPNPYLSKVNLDSQYPSGFDPGWAKIQEPITQEGENLSFQWEKLPPARQTYSLDKTVIRVNLARELAPGESTSITIHFTTKIPHKSIMDEEYYKNTYIWRFGWYPTLASPDWWKEYDREIYSQYKLPTANYSVSLNLPKDFTTGGNITSETLIKPEKSRKLVKLTLGSARSFPLVTGPAYKKYIEKFEKYRIKTLHKPGYEEEARILASYANEILTFYSDQFGECKRTHLTFVQSPISGYFGLAADGMIVIGNSFFTEKSLLVGNITDRLSEYLIAHEIGHQWFGIGVGADLNTYNWLSEAFAEFLALRYFETKYGADDPNLFQLERSGLIQEAMESQLGYVNLREHMFELQYLLQYQKGFDEAVVKPTEEVDYAQATQTRLYKKGYLILRTLESIVGKDAMNKIIAKTFALHRSDIINVENFESIVRSVSKKPIPKDFFSDWLFTAGHLDYGIDSLTSEKIESGEYLTKIRVFKHGTLTAPTTLQLTLESDKTIRQQIQIKKDEKTISIVTQEKVVRASIDPEDRVMDTNRLNNHFPMKVKISVGDNALPLDAYSIVIMLGTVSGRDVGTTSWIIGPGVAQANLDLNRNLSLSGQIAVGGNNLKNLFVEGALGASYKLWSQPETGSASQYWVQNKTINFEYQRSHDKDADESYNLFGIQADFSREISENRTLSLGLYGSLSGFSKISAAARESTRLFPGVHLHFNSSVGIGVGDLPEFFAYELDELSSYGSYQVDNTGIPIWVKKGFPGKYKLFSKVTLDFPILSDANYYLGTLALVSDVRQGIFFSAGDTWNSFDEFNLSDFKLEAGIEVQMSGTTLGGLFPFDLTLGYAYHGRDIGRPFISFALDI